MRCPKCSFISFDHLSACVKCSKDLTVTAAELHGTVANVEAFPFLNSVLDSMIEDEAGGSDMDLDVLEDGIDEEIEADGEDGGTVVLEDLDDGPELTSDGKTIILNLDESREASGETRDLADEDLEEETEITMKIDNQVALSFQDLMRKRDGGTPAAASQVKVIEPEVVAADIHMDIGELSLVGMAEDDEEDDNEEDMVPALENKGPIINLENIDLSDLEPDTPGTEADEAAGMADELPETRRELDGLESLRLDAGGDEDEEEPDFALGGLEEDIGNAAGEDELPDPVGFEDADLDDVDLSTMVEEGASTAEDMKSKGLAINLDQFEEDGEGGLDEDGMELDFDDGEIDLSLDDLGSLDDFDLDGGLAIDADEDDGPTLDMGDLKLELDDSDKG